MPKHTLSCARAALLLLGLCSPTLAMAGQRVAVLVGVTDYASLPDTLDLPATRADLPALAAYLEERGGFDKVHVLMDKAATRAAVRTVLVETVAPSMQPGDTLLWIFAGQGFGGDFGNPYLLLYDSTVEDTASTIDFYSFTRDLLRRTPGVNLVVITDAAHPGEQDGVALLGPNAKSLADLPGNFLALSATGPREVSDDGLFLPRLQSALEGKADSNDDKMVGAAELHRHMLEVIARESKDGAHPAEAGSYDPNLIVSFAGGRASFLDQLRAENPDGRREVAFGGPLSFGLMGAGALVAGSLGLYGNVHGRELCAVADGVASCDDQASFILYQRNKTLTHGAYAAGAVLFGAGLGLGFVPLESGGAWFGVEGKF